MKKKIPFSALMLLRPVLFITVQMALAAGFLWWGVRGGPVASAVTQPALRIALRLVMFGVMQAVMFLGFRKWSKPTGLPLSNRGNR